MRLLGHFAHLGQILGMKVLETVAPYWHILWAWGFWGILGSNIRQEKLTKFTKIFNYIKFSCAKLFLYFRIYISFTKRIETFCSRDIKTF